jgi:hypothetical protein
MLQPNHAALTLCFTDFPDRFYRKQNYPERRRPTFRARPTISRRPARPRVPGALALGQVMPPGPRGQAVRSTGRRHVILPLGGAQFCVGRGGHKQSGPDAGLPRFGPMVPRRSSIVAMAPWRNTVLAGWPLGAIPCWRDGPLAQYRVGPRAPWGSSGARWRLRAGSRRRAFRNVGRWRARHSGNFAI